MKKVTHQEIQEEIVKIFQKERIHIQGVLPQKVSDLPTKFTKPSWKSRTKNEYGEYSTKRVKNKYWRKAYANIANSRRPKRSKANGSLWKVATTPVATPKQAFAPQEERAQTNNTVISITLPQTMSAKALIDLIAIIRKSGAKCSL